MNLGACLKKMKKNHTLTRIFTIRSRSRTIYIHQKEIKGVVSATVL